MPIPSIGRRESRAEPCYGKLNTHFQNLKQKKSQPLLIGICIFTRNKTLGPNFSILLFNYLPNGILGMPFIMAAAAAGLENCFIILRMSSNCLMSLVTSSTLLPEPFAIRKRRLC